MGVSGSLSWKHDCYVHQLDQLVGLNVDFNNYFYLARSSVSAGCCMAHVEVTNRAWVLESERMTLSNLLLHLASYNNILHQSRVSCILNVSLESRILNSDLC